MVTIWMSWVAAALQKAYEYIQEDSPQNADKVINEISKIGIELGKHPEKYPPDKYKNITDTGWRVFEKHRYRITYVILENEIVHSCTTYQQKTHPVLTLPPKCGSFYQYFNKITRRFH